MTWPNISRLFRPCLPATFPVLNALNIMHLKTPQSADAVGGNFQCVDYRSFDTTRAARSEISPHGRGMLLRHNLLVYGIGGMIMPFIGIKLIDLVITRIGMA